MDTDIPRFWIESIFRFDDDPETWEFEGLRFDEYYGFGNPSGRHFTGSVAYLKGHDKTVDNVTIQRGHRTQSGFFYTLTSGSDKLPEPPFLLTGELDTIPQFSGTLEVLPSEESKDYADSLDVNEVISIGAREWYGIARLVSRRPITFDVVTFGKGASKPTEGDILFELDTNEVFGRVLAVNCKRSNS